MKVYVASSWRNDRQSGVVTALRAAGHEVYDFRHPKPGNDGFRWDQCGDAAERYRVGGRAEDFRSMLDAEVARHGFALDHTAMEWADAIVMVQPCGRSAHLELGWGCGKGKPTAVLLADAQEPELMLKEASYIATDLLDIIEWLAMLVIPPPRYDEVFARGTAWLNSGGGEARQLTVADELVVRESFRLPWAVDPCGLEEVGVDLSATRDELLVSTTGLMRFGVEQTKAFDDAGRLKAHGLTLSVLRRGPPNEDGSGTYVGREFVWDETGMFMWSRALS